MGVPGFYKWLCDNKEKFKCNNVIINEITNKPDVIDYLMIDGNGSFHMCLKYNIDDFKNGNLKNRVKNIKNPRKEIIKNTINSFTNLLNFLISTLNCKNVFIAIDGVAPVSKIIQQRQRRYKYLFDSLYRENPENNFENNIETTFNKKIFEPNIPIRSIELTPGTNLMEELHNAISNYLKKMKNCDVNIMYSSYHSEGEGEHKIIQYIKNQKLTNQTTVIYGLDADLMFLCLSLGKDYSLFIMREKQIFNNEDIDLSDTLVYNYVDVIKLHELIENIKISVDDFILLCFLIGNDFLPRLISIDIKRHGIDKIIDTFIRTFESQLVNSPLESILVKRINENNENNGNNKKSKIVINHQALLHYFKKLCWTEKFLWKNINRKRDDRDYNDIMKKFIEGKNENIEFLEKLEFNSKNEFYNYYLGTNSVKFSKETIENIVHNFVSGIEWCLQYYLNECQCWSWGYNFLIAPLLEDIIRHYPKKIIFKKNKRKLKPVEQLLIAIPKHYYKYVIESDIIDRFESNLELGYMMPVDFNIDVNKESIYWKCGVKIPPVEYFDLTKNIKKLNINNDKNNISDEMVLNK